MDTRAYRKKFSVFGLRMLACAFVINGVQISAQIVLVLLKPEWISNINIILAFTMISQYVVGFPCAFLIMSDDGDKREIEKHKMKLSHFLIAYMMGYALLVAGNLIGLGVTYGIGVLKGEPVSNSLQNLVGDTNIWITSIYVVLCAPVLEELLFRKVICDRMVKYGQGAAIIMSGLVFGLFHGNFNQFFYAWFIGSFFAFIYVKTGNIKYTIGLHMMVNFVGSVVARLFLDYVDLEHLTPVSMLIMLFYVMIVYGIVIAGIVLLILNKSKLRTNDRYMGIDTTQRNIHMLVNVGMILYYVFFFIMMMVQALLV